MIKRFLGNHSELTHILAVVQGAILAAFASNASFRQYIIMLWLRVYHALPKGIADFLLLFLFPLVTVAWQLYHNGQIATTAQIEPGSTVTNLKVMQTQEKPPQ